MKRFARHFLARPGLLLLAIVGILASGWIHRALTTVDDAAAADNTRRIAVISTDNTPSTSNVLHGTLIAGVLSSGAHEATVINDRNCTPDAEGISHCLNDLAVGTKRITIQHHHRMRKVPCLRPGEPILVMDKETFVEQYSS